MIGSYLLRFSQVPLHFSFDVEAPHPCSTSYFRFPQSVRSSLRYLPLLLLQPFFSFIPLSFIFSFNLPSSPYLRASPTSHEPSPYVLADPVRFVDPRFYFLYCLFHFLCFLFISRPLSLVYGNSCVLSTPRSLLSSSSILNMLVFARSSSTLRFLASAEVSPRFP